MSDRPSVELQTEPDPSQRKDRSISIRTSETADISERIIDRMNEILPQQVLQLLTDQPGIFERVQKLEAGQQLDVQIDRYAMDAFSFEPLNSNDELSESTRALLRKALMSECIRLSDNSWISSREDEEKYVLISIDTKTTAHNTDTKKRQQRMAAFFSRTVHEIVQSQDNPELTHFLEHNKLTHMTVADCMYGAIGQQVDASQDDKPKGHIYFTKNEDEDVVVFQNMPAERDFIFSPVVLSEIPTLQKMKQQMEHNGVRYLPIVIHGDVPFTLESKRISYNVTFIPTANTDEQVEDPPQNSSVSPDVALWAFQHLRESYLTPKDLLTLLGTHFSKSEQDTKQILELVLRGRWSKISVDTLEIEQLNNIVSADLSGMSYISTQIKDNTDAMIGFQKMTTLWQTEIAALYKKYGFAADEFGGDGVKALQLTDTTTGAQTHIQMNLEIQTLWEQLIQTAHEDQSIQTFVDWYKRNDVQKKVFTKTAFIGEDTVTLRYYKAGVLELIPTHNIEDMMRVLKQKRSELKVDGPAVIVTAEYYLQNKTAIDTEYFVYPASGQQEEHLEYFIIVPNNTSQEKTTPREQLELYIN